MEKKQHLIFVILLLLLCFSCKTYKENSASLENVFFADNRIISAYLRKEVSLLIANNRICFHRGTLLQFYPNGSLSSGYLARDQELLINGYKFKAKAVGNLGFSWGQYDISFHYNGSIDLIWLAEEAYVMINDTEFIFSAADKIIPIALDGYNDKAVGYREYLCFYENGQVQSGFLAKPIIIGAEKIPAGALVRFNKSGNVRNYSMNGVDDIEILDNK